MSDIETEHLEEEKDEEEVCVIENSSMHYIINLYFNFRII
jgi:hypothetical protein